MTKTCRAQSAETKTKINKDKNNYKNKDKDRDKDKTKTETKTKPKKKTETGANKGGKNIKRGTHLSSLPRFAAVESLEANVISRFPC